MSVLDEIKWIDLPSNRDERGVLTSIESGMDIPFKIKRVFYMHHVEKNRGGHAHRDTDQVVIALVGDFMIDFSDGSRTNTYHLDDPTKGLFMPRMVFTRLYDFSKDAVCAVLANTHYEISRSIRSWEDYMEEIGQTGQK